MERITNTEPLKWAKRLILPGAMKVKESGYYWVRVLTFTLSETALEVFPYRSDTITHRNNIFTGSFFDLLH